MRPTCPIQKPAPDEDDVPTAQELRSEVDRTLATQLLVDPAVQHLREELERAGKLGTRRSLLARALRLSRSIAPDVHTMLDRCIEILGVEAEVELYVHASATFNAGCTPVEDGRVFILVTSALLEGFESTELIYVLGHELGHHIYGHHAIPLGLILQQAKNLSPALVLKAHTWQRHAELSADRAGMLCCGGLNGAARGLFKLSSGLSQAPSDDAIAAFVEQAHALYDEDVSERVSHSDWLSTHPFSPVRLRAGQVFQRFLDGTVDQASLEQESAELLALMEASYLEEDSEGAEAMRRLLFAAGAVVAAADGEVSASEMDSLAELLGPGRVPRSLNPKLLRSLIDERVACVNDRVPGPRRVQLVRDLTLIARSDGRLTSAEVRVIREVAEALKVDPEVVDVVLESPTEVY